MADTELKFTSELWPYHVYANHRWHGETLPNGTKIWWGPVPGCQRWGHTFHPGGLTDAILYGFDCFAAFVRGDEVEDGIT